MAETGRVIGEHQCRQCGKRVRLKANAKDRVYYYCDGTVDAGACLHHEKFGPWISRDIIERLAKRAELKGGENEQGEQPGRRVETGKSDAGKPTARNSERGKRFGGILGPS